MALELYGTARSPYAARCRMFVYAKALDVRFINIEEALTPLERKKLNPAGKIPILVADNRVIVESDVICEYLEEIYPKPPMLPRLPVDRAFVRSLAKFSDEYVLKRALSLLRFVKQNQLDPAEIESDLVSLSQGLSWLEELMPVGCRYLAGDALSLADFIAVPAFWGVKTFSRILGVRNVIDEFEKISHYSDSIERLDAANTVTQEMLEALQPYFPVLR